MFLVLSVFKETSHFGDVFLLFFLIKTTLHVEQGLNRQLSGYFLNQCGIAVFVFNRNGAACSRCLDVGVFLLVCQQFLLFCQCGFRMLESPLFWTPGPVYPGFANALGDFWLCHYYLAPFGEYVFVLFGVLKQILCIHFF